jgi:Sap, sulfolipid-1-addressing protein
MGQGISEVLTYAIGVDISLLSIIAVILMLFSPRARVNGPAFLVGWMGTLAVVSGVVYVVSTQSDAATSTTTADTISWGKIVFGMIFLLLSVRTWRNRPAPDAKPEMPKWMASVDSL